MCHAFARNPNSESRKARGDRGFSLLELLVASALGVIVLGGTVILVRQSLVINSMLGQKADLQQGARVSLKVLARDVSLAGTGLPLGAIQLPTGENSEDSRFGCGPIECYVANGVYTDDRIYGVTPSNNLGSRGSDMVTVVFRDPESNLDDSPLAAVSTDGTSVTVDSSLAAEASQVETGDVLLVCNVNGCAAAAVTGVSGTTLQLASGDPLSFNQPEAASGSVSGLDDPSNPGNYPPTQAFAISIVSYFLDGLSGQLMRQVNAHPAVAVAENVEDIQITFDVFSSTGSGANSGLDDAGGRPNDIRKVNLLVRFAAPEKALMADNKQRLSFSTSVSTRNLTFQDRYQ